jgi:indole-3-glycerol phosphate synthase
MRPSILNKIKKYKLKEIENNKKALPFSELEQRALCSSKPIGFEKALKSSLSKTYAIIAEIKRASPSKGLIRNDFNVSKIAKAYTHGGAACLSVLTDAPSFGGNPKFIAEARSASHLPILRKDFMYDPYQVFESRLLGADCILIIMASVGDNQANELEQTAFQLGLDVLIEVHNIEELNRALKLKSSLLGINNRNLNSFEVRLETTEELTLSIPSEKIIITESGLKSSADLERMYKCGARGFLIGETLMRQADVEAALRKIIPSQEIIG